MDSKENRIIEEDTLDLKHIFIYLVKRWKSIILFAVIGCLLGVMIQTITPPATERSKKDSLLVDRMEMVALSRSQYERIKAYASSSPFMKLNSKNVYVGDARYFISDCADKDFVAEIIESFLKDNSIQKQVSTILSITDEVDIDKMVTVTADSNNDAIVIGETEIEQFTSKDHFALSFCVYASTEQQAEQVLTILDNKLTQVQKTSSGEQEFKLHKIARDVNLGKSQDLLNEQNTVIDELNASYDSLIALENSFTEEQYSIYETYVLPGKTSEIPVVLFPSSPIKKPVIFALIFAFLTAVFHIVRYLTSAVILNVDNITTATGTGILGFIDGAARKKLCIDRMLDSWEKTCFPPCVSDQYIASAIKNLESSVVIYDESDKRLCEVADAISKIDSSIRFAGLISESRQTVESLSHGASAVLLVRLGGTAKAQLKQEVSIFDRYDISLAGSVVVR